MAAAAGIRVVPLTRSVGAEVSGVDLTRPLKVEEAERLRAALLDHLVLFFRDQAMTAEQHLAFARQFGEISIPPFAPRYGDDSAMMVLDQIAPEGEGGDAWHSDNTFMETPPMGSILRAVELPAVGGDTCFASMFAAFEALSPSLQGFLEGLTAIHDITAPLRKGIEAGHIDADLEQMREQWPPVEHPVVRTHPDSGRKALFVNSNSTSRIVQLSDSENAVALPFLLAHVRSPNFQCRFRWQVDSVAFWDNRSVQHYAVPDYVERRVMNRVTLEGDRPY
ncbi:TauD/TfdA family dioxygenase [Myxococcota bacterium]|nr:TauD/TfdA family dioxygenase [Myxococcota bacterium]